jgi:hypothetical protein
VIERFTKYSDTVRQKVSTEFTFSIMDKANPVWTISKEVGVKSPTFSLKAKSKAVPVNSSHNNSVLNSGVLLGVANLPHSSPQPGEEEGENLVHLQPVPEHEDDEGGGGVPELLPKPRRKFGSITAYLSPSKQVRMVLYCDNNAHPGCVLSVCLSATVLSATDPQSTVSA